jgi:hypothetical protein
VFGARSDWSFVLEDFWSVADAHGQLLTIGYELAAMPSGRQREVGGRIRSFGMRAGARRANAPSRASRARLRGYYFKSDAGRERVALRYGYPVLPVPGRHCRRIERRSEAACELHRVVVAPKVHEQHMRLIHQQMTVQRGHGDPVRL